ncbi:MAG TPA: sugar phosphate isomerase/epimerase family protein [Candidatus Dormibacteraeota bacterium]|jgi:L-ribulose-5-phosphate 3-epimerase|nr:sugar phosphate isomerase/epimerase family protein [Candidatus Dormibacteraeota bacterium]
MKRRELLKKAGLAAGAMAIPKWTNAARVPKLDCVFQLSIITDEISQDFGHALEVAVNEFGLSYIELRGLWKKNILNLDEKEIAEAKSLIAKYDLKVTDIASPLFKVDWPGAPKSKFSPTGAAYSASFTFEQQDEVLEKSIAIAKTFGTNKVRMFDFWKLEDDKPYRDAMDAKIRDFVAKAAKKDAVLVLENEYECNSATGAQAARTLAAVPAKNFVVNWDPGNAAADGEVPFPDGYSKLPKDRIGHVHLKDVISKPDGKFGWAAMGQGKIAYVEQFKALMKDGYRGTMSLETHWNGGGTPEESSRQSMAGTKDLLRKAGALK